MRYTLFFLTLALAACGSTPSKTGTENSANNNSNNVVLNNQTSNNQTSNNVVVLNNDGLAICQPDPVTGEPERLLGLSGVEFADRLDALLVDVQVDSLTFLVGDAEGRFFFEGGDLTQLFESDTEIIIRQSESNGDETGVRLQSIAGPTATGAEIAWGTGSSFTDDPPTPVVNLPLAAATVSLGPTTSSETCLVDAECIMQARTRRVHDILVEYRNETTAVSAFTELTDDEYSFRSLGAQSSSFVETSADVCVAEGGSFSSFIVTSWGRVFL